MLEPVEILAPDSWEQALAAKADRVGTRQEEVVEAVRVGCLPLDACDGEQRTLHGV